MGKIGLLYVCIFSCNTSYISNMVTSPGVPKIARTASILSNFSSQYSRQRRKWSGVPVARISIGFPTAAPGKSLLFNSSTTGPSSLGTFSPPLLSASVSITPGPPAWVMMAKFFPFSSGKEPDITDRLAQFLVQANSNVQYLPYGTKLPLPSPNWQWHLYVKMPHDYHFHCYLP